MTSDSEWETYTEQTPVRGTVDEWETWDTTAPVVTSTTSLDIAQAAEDASVLLELFSKTAPRNSNAIDDEHKQMIENAFESILRIRREFRVTAAARVPVEEAKADPECIICYDNIADTVLMPCKHLVLCMVSPLFPSSPVHPCSPVAVLTTVGLLRQDGNQRENRAGSQDSPVSNLPDKDSRQGACSSVFQCKR